MFHIWIYYRDGFWVYEALNPAQNVYWWIIVAGIPVIQIFGFFLLLFVNYSKNRAFLAGNHYFQPLLVNQVGTVGIYRSEHYKIELFISQIIILGSVCYLFFMSLAPIYTGVFWGFFVVILVYVVSEWFTTYHNIQYLVYEVIQLKDPLLHKQIVMETLFIDQRFVYLANAVSLLLLLGLGVAAFITMIIVFTTNMFWIYFAITGIAAMILLVKIFQFTYVLPYLFRNQSIHEQDILYLESYFD
jgi:hypothetical protein